MIHAILAFLFCHISRTNSCDVVPGPGDLELEMRG